MTIVNPDVHADRSNSQGFQVEESQGREAAEFNDFHDALEAMYPADEIAQKTAELLESSNFDEKANGRRWAVVILEGKDPMADVAKRVETERFSTFFGTHPLEHIADYGIYDDSSIFVAVIDATHAGGPKAASALRIVRNSDRGFKTINSLTNPDPSENPWADDLKEIVGDFGYEDKDRVQSMIEQAMHINPESTWSIESMAALEEFAGSHGLVGEATFPLYAACLQLSNSMGIESWISIQDLKPMLQMQELFNDPWEWLTLPPKKYEGPFLTIPAFISDMAGSQEALRKINPDMASLIIDGIGLSESYVMPEELQGEAHLQSIASQ